MPAPPLNLLTCPEWGARAPKHEIRLTSRASRIVIHHTAGHHAEIVCPRNESKAEAIRYARAIQDFHMDVNGWADSGHNFLVCRNGLVLQGRWSTVAAVEHGRMVISAHCPGQNDQVGLEHEHEGTEPMTIAQRKGSAALIAWVSWHYRRQLVLPLVPHRKFVTTDCPANLEWEIPHLHSLAQDMLTAVSL